MKGINPFRKVGGRRQQAPQTHVHLDRDEASRYFNHAAKPKGVIVDKTTTPKPKRKKERLEAKAVAEYRENLIRRCKWLNARAGRLPKGSNERQGIEAEVAVKTYVLTEVFKVELDLQENELEAVTA